MFWVQTPAASPYTMSLPIASASSSSVNGMIDSTGPKTSSCAMRIEFFTPLKIVGSTNQPSPHSGALGRFPPSTGVAPSAFAISMYFSTFSSCGLFVMGPTWVSSSIGFPIFAVFASARSLSTN